MLAEHLLIPILSFAALLVAAFVGVLGFRMSSSAAQTARDTLNFQTIQAMHKERLQTFQEQLDQMQTMVRRHEQHIDRCEEELSRLRQQVNQRDL